MKAGLLLIAAMMLVMTPAAIGGSPHAAQTLENPPGVDPDTGYRMERYRAPVPDRIPGGTLVDADRLAALIADDPPILIDVYPPKGAGADPLGRVVAGQRSPCDDPGIRVAARGRTRLS